MDTFYIKATVVLTQLLLLLDFPHFATGLNCYQCDSTLDSNCQENWDHSLKVNELKYRPCNLWDAKYCVKVTGMWGGVVGTHRFCSARDMGDQCQDISFPDHDRMYRACVFTCDSEGCNSASTVSIHAAFYSVILAVCGKLIWNLL